LKEKSISIVKWPFPHQESLLMIWMLERALGKLGFEKGEGGARRIYFKKKPMIQKARCNRDVTEVRERFWRIIFAACVVHC
jgi:hypothetical protein